VIEYRRDAELTLEKFIHIYQSSTLGERRPTGDRDVMRQMMENADLTVTAWDGDQLVGISRTLTDFGYVAYLSDLAVAQSHQRLGIGKHLIEQTRAALGEKCMLVLLAAPAASEYYPHIGFTHHPRAWILEADQPLGTAS